MAKKLLEISLNKLRIEENGEVTRREGRNVLTASLIYPARGKRLVTTVKSLKLGDHQEVDFVGGKDPATGRRYTWADRILFKEEIVDHSLLVVQLTNVAVPAKLEKFLAGVFTTIFAGAWAAVSGGITNLVLATVMESAASAHLESLKVDGERLDVIGDGALDLDVAALPAEAEIPLVVPCEVSVPRLVFGPNGKVKREERLVLAAGAENGSVTLQIRVL